MQLSKKWFQKGIAALLSAALMIGQVVSVSAAELPMKQEESLKIATLSDAHYLSPDMIKDTEDFQTHLNSDRKMFAESDAFLTALLDTIKGDDPDVLLISGDLTKDGEKEGHEALAEKLEAFREEEMPDLHIYVTPGNHDLNNSNGMNFNTEDGVAVPAGRTTQDDFKQIYADVTYHDETVIATFQPEEGKQGGGLSYVARPKDGFTIISIDSARYSADNTDSGMDEHETSGAISADLEQWVLEQIAAAKQRGDTVIGMEHHGMIPHFSMEPDLLPMYLVNDYERLSREFADAGMQYIFTGHMHANDIASLTTEQGNTLYDIETGSVVTYPSPARSVTITRNIENGTVQESMDVKTYTGVGPITFTNPVTGQEQTIEDISAYGREHGFSNDMLSTTVNGFLHDYYTQIAQAGGIRPVLLSLVNDMTGMSFGSFDQLIDVGLPLLLPKEEGKTIYYDSTQGGVVIMVDSLVSLRVLVPVDGLKQTLNILLDKVDQEIQDPENLDAVIENLVASLTSVPAAEGKTLLDYANFLYQSHLGGEDNQEQPAWVTETTASIESGQLLDQVVDVLVQDIANLLDSVLANIPAQEVLGSNSWDNAAEPVKALIPLEGRTPLLSAMDSSTGSVLSMLFGTLGAKWEKDPDNSNVLVMPEGSNPEIGYSLGDFLNALKGTFVGNMIGLKKDFSFAAILDELLNGTPATEDGPATEGILTEEIKGQINGWLLNLVNSMGKDDNCPQDNDTTLSYEWKLLTDRTALDEAIAKAEGMDLSLYTEESAQVVKDALDHAKGLSLTVPQEEMDSAADALNAALDALEEKAEGGNAGNTGEDPEKPDSGDHQKPGDSSGLPQTGDANNLGQFAAYAVLSGAAALLLFLHKNRANVK